MKTFKPPAHDFYKFAVHTVTDPGDFLKFTARGPRAYYPEPGNPEWLRWALKTDLKLVGSDTKRRYGHVGDADRIAGDAPFVFLHVGARGHERATVGGITFDLLFRVDTLFNHGRVGLRVVDGADSFTHAVHAFAGDARIACAESLARALTIWNGLQVRQALDFLTRVLVTKRNNRLEDVRDLIPVGLSVGDLCRYAPENWTFGAESYPPGWSEKKDELIDLYAMLRGYWEDFLTTGDSHSGEIPEFLFYGALPVREAVGWRTRAGDPWNVEAP